MRPIIKKILRIFLYVHGFLLMALLLTHCSFSHYAKKAYERAGKEKPYDVIIVPGVPYQKDESSSVMKMRVLWAKHLYDSGYTRHIIFSGSAVYSPYVEGIVMKIMADSLGIPAAITFSETKAEHSTENIYYSWKMAKEMGFAKIALATDPFQSRMLKSFIKRYCPGVASVPVVFDIVSFDNRALPVIEPRDAFRADFVSIKEREGFWERFRGTMGKRVKEEQQESLIERQKNQSSN
ncbi:MAG: YdcF family protein [Cyclobacteriaceae bacterium]|nr:YdcF family protein [Cyclobacteriaceae bacterium]